MEDNLKSNWKKVGKDFAALGKDFGKTLAKTIRKGVNMATEWANEPDTPEKPVEEEKTQE